MRKFFGLQLMDEREREGGSRVSPFIPHNGLRLHLEIQLNICSSVTLLYIIIIIIRVRIIIIIMVGFIIITHYHCHRSQTRGDGDCDGDDCAASCVRFWGHSSGALGEIASDLFESDPWLYVLLTPS